MAPIGLIVLLLHKTVAPMPPKMLGLFLLALLMLILGMGLFSLGADLSMMPMGERIGAQLTRSKNLKLLALTALVMGVLINRGRAGPAGAGHSGPRCAGPCADSGGGGGSGPVSDAGAAAHCVPPEPPLAADRFLWVGLFAGRLCLAGFSSGGL